MKNQFGTGRILAVVSACILVVCAALFLYLFEIKRADKRTNPSGRAKSNAYLAVDRWQDETGHAVRIENSSGFTALRNANEGVIQIYSSSYRWSEFDMMLPRLAEEGKHIVIFIDDSGNDVLTRLLTDGGVSYRLFSSYKTQEDKDADKEKDELEKKEAEENKDAEPKKKILFDRVIYFKIEKDAKVKWEFEEDSSREIRLIRAKLGKGSLTVTGIPIFMRWAALMTPESTGYRKNEAEAAWRIGGGLDTEKAGILVIRNALSSLDKKTHTDEEKTFWSALLRQSRTAAVLFSALALVIIGLWMTLPQGRVRPERSPPGRSIRDRFYAESRFYSRYGRLSIYKDCYINELKTGKQRHGAAHDELIAEIEALEVRSSADLQKLVRLYASSLFS